MRKLIFTLSFIIAIVFSGNSQVTKMIGRWKTIDDVDGTPKSIVFVFKATNGKYYGKIEKLFKDPTKLCTECEGAKKNQLILGMLIINDMIEEDGKLTGGTILDPKKGKVYKCNISLDSSNGDKLKVRGSLDSGGLLGRSQTWLRAN
jgi:uncharacterized protein (DUF2147 family)